MKQPFTDFTTIILTSFFPPFQNVLEREIVTCRMIQKYQPVHAIPVILVASLGYDDLDWAMKKKSLPLLVYWLWVRFILPARPRVR